MKKLALTTLALAALAFGFTACGDEEDDMMTTDHSLTLSFTGLPDLGADYVYEGWLMVDGAPVSSGRFSVDADGMLSQSTFTIDADAAMATAFILSIEPAMGDDPAPAATHVVAGDLMDGSATLSIDHGAALGTDFAAAMGTYLIAAPSSADETDDAQGIWFVDMSSGAPMASLDLPALPDGWAYEGWVVDTSGDAPAPVSTGVFTEADMPDEDGAGAEAGPEMTPPFPGQDYITMPRDLTMNYMAVISIEPVPDNSPMPFQLKPLAGMIGMDTGMVPHMLDASIGANTITGVAMVE